MTETWNDEDRKAIIDHLRERVGPDVSNNGPDAQTEMIDSLLNSPAGQARLTRYMKGYNDRQTAGYDQDRDDHFATKNRDSLAQGNLWLRNGAIGAALAGSGFALYKLLMKKRPEDIVEEEGMGAMPGTSFVNMPWAKAASAEKTAGLLEVLQRWALPVGAGVYFKKDIGNAVNRGVGHIKTMDKPKHPMHHSMMWPALGLGVPAIAGLAYMLTNKGITMSRHSSTDEQLAAVKEQLRQTLTGEYNAGEEKESAQMLDKLAASWERGELFEKQADPEAADVNPQDVEDEMRNRAVPPTDSPLQGLWGSGKGAAALLAAGLLLTSFSASKSFFDKSDPNRAKTKALRDALRQRMRLSQPNLQLMSPEAV